MGVANDQRVGGPGVQDAWVARLGFVSFGLSVILLATVCQRRWGPWGVGMHATFGALMIAAAAFSHRPWQTTLEYDRTEDFLHSVAATGMGFAFALGSLPRHCGGGVAADAFSTRSPLLPQ